MSNNWIEEKPYVNIPCPVCKGTGKKFDTSLWEYVDTPCTACLGRARYVYDIKEEIKKAREKYLKEYRKRLIPRNDAMRESTSYKSFLVLCERAGIKKVTKAQAYTIRAKMKREGEVLEQWFSPKLTNEKVGEIKKALIEKTPQKELAIKYNVTVGTISGIFIGRTWKHVEVTSE